MILVVDDEPMIRELLRATLTADGYDVEVAEGVEAAVELAARRRPELVVSDLWMAGGSGLDLLAGLRAAGVTAPFALCTGSDPGEYRARAMALGVDAILPKPFSLSDLERTAEALTSPRAA